MTKQSAPESVFTFDQSRLDISARSRTSRLPWRGQFSPEFVEYMMDNVCSDADVFYDPFCGSGTVLYEALQRSKFAIGAEVNPAAWHFAALSSFSEVASTEQAQIISELRRLAADACPGPLFKGRSNLIHDCIQDSDAHPFFKMAVAATILLGMGNGVNLDQAGIARGCFLVLSILNEILENDGSHSAHCLLSDARDIKLDSEIIDAVITSPPYINVFNYHQNYRAAAELLGWRPLQAALSEIGANRKYRQNRFLTAVQYSIDMGACIFETARLMRPGSPFIMVLGRTSNVLGASLKNGEIIGDAIRATRGFDHIHWAERSFVNRFGEKIYEDILITHRNQRVPQFSDDEMRHIGVKALRDAFSTVPAKNQELLLGAIHNADSVKASPPLELSIPLAFEGFSTKELQGYGSNTYRCAR